VNPLALDFDVAIMLRAMHEEMQEWDAYMQGQKEGIPPGRIYHGDRDAPAVRF